MPVKYPRLKMVQHEGAMDYRGFCRAVAALWEKSHPDIKMVAQGSRLFANPTDPILTYHLQRRVPADSTPAPRVMEAFDDETLVVDLSGVESAVVNNIQTFRQDFENTVVFTIHVPLEKGGGEVADLLCEDFERFMLEHTGVLRALGAQNLRYAVRFHDDNLMKEMSSNTVKRFVAYTLYTQNVTQNTVQNLKNIEVEIRASLDSEDIVKTELNESSWLVTEQSS